MKGEGLSFESVEGPFWVRVKVSRFGVWGIGVKFGIEWVGS